MYLKEIWRYPVKSMRGERIPSSEVLKTGLSGDRQIVVISASAERLITARTHPGLLGLQGSIDLEGKITIDNLPWDSRDARLLVSEAAREEVQLLNLQNDTDRFDVLPLLVATDGAIEDLDIDRRRLRPNIIVGGVSGQAERSWPGRQLKIGNLKIDVAQLRMRCVMTTYDPDTLVQDRGVLKRILEQARGKTALDCSVRSPGTIWVEDPVELR
jgi:uncharacterized protein YcbX